MASIYLTSEDALRYVRVLTEMLQIMTSSPEDFQGLQSRRICSDELLDESITTLTAINRLFGDVGKIRITAEDIDRLASKLIA